ncbi:alpha/beta hydrolase [Martelella alba]|uniref:Alpha/beta hydrolase n=1 Tax=Martelella alba TaxID=2590451 RepID=A0A506UC92_9HYPH|nr:alpha/beta hydrolase [Martelella alba]TPW31540.1 alpha/beta hydrolase [Martelella alba]
MINPELDAFLADWNGKWARLKQGATPQERRAHFEIVASEMRLATPEDVSTDRVEWTQTPAGPVRSRIFRHKTGGTQACLIYLHGGAWMQGSPETHWDITSRIAGWNRQTVISVDYALTPEHPFPAALDQVNAVAKWAHDEAASLGIDPARIAIGGDSAGGNLAAASTLDMRGSAVNYVAQLLVYPACDFELDRPSMIANAEAPLLQTRGMKAVNAMYSPDPAVLFNPRIAPLLAESHAGLPPAFVAVAENDPLHDSGALYARALEAAGVPVTFDEGEGLIHGYLRSMGYSPTAMTKFRAMADWLSAY